MNCQEFWDRMPEISNQASGLEHTAACPECAARWEQQRAVSAGLRQLAADWRGIGAPPRLEARLMSAFRAHSGLAPRPGRPWIPVATWAAAAAVLLTTAVSLMRVDQPPTAPRHRPSSQIELAAVGPAAVEESVEAGDLENGFIPLPNAEGLAPTDDVNLVRVEVPRSAMIALGFAVNADRASEPVEAEVVLGPDGVARAVRFLDEASNY